MSLRLQNVGTPGLGDSTYVMIHEGLALVVDPQRDVDRFQRVLDDAGADLRFVLETHVHNDYISGGTILARAADAELVMPAGAAPAFKHKPAFHMEDMKMGDLTIRPIHTPGHTPEHVSYLIIVDGAETAVFSGGSLLVGSAGRSDLLGDERAESLARLQYGSVRRLAALSPDVQLLPTHGAGSFCTTTRAGSTTSTIGDEVRANPVLAYPDEDAFVAGELSGLVPYPSYYRFMAPMNLRDLPEPNFEVPVIDEIPEDSTVIDGRPMEEFAAGHLHGSLGVELRDSFGTWVGWITEHNVPIVLVLNRDQNLDDAVRQLARIGYDRVLGVVHDLTGDLESFTTVGPEAFAEAASGGAQIVDTRAPDEWEAGTIEGAMLTYAPDLATDTPGALSKDDQVWVACGSGYRATIAASFLKARGFEPVVLANAGVTDVLRTRSNSK